MNADTADDLDNFDAAELRRRLRDQLAEARNAEQHIRELEKQYMLADTRLREVEKQYRTLDGQNRELKLEHEDLEAKLEHEDLEAKLETARAAKPAKSKAKAELAATPPAPAPEAENKPPTTEPAPAAPSQPATAEAPAPVFSSATEWANKWFAPMTQRSVRKWCPTWWEHPEAQLRIESMWRTWEAARLDSVSGMSTWLLHHFDPHMAQLTSVEGTFCSCTLDKHNTPPQALDPFSKPLQAAQQPTAS